VSDNAFAKADNDASALARPRAFGTIVYGGLAVGVLDALDAMIFFGIRNGVKPLASFSPSRVGCSVALLTVAD
jgi:hypothetical protein